jgi:hypothetical protein
MDENTLAFHKALITFIGILLLFATAPAIFVAWVAFVSSSEGMSGALIRLLYLICPVLAVIGGIGTLRLRKWGRWATVLFSLELFVYGAYQVASLYTSKDSEVMAYVLFAGIFCASATFLFIYLHPKSTYLFN